MTSSATELLKGEVDALLKQPPPPLSPTEESSSQTAGEKAYTDVRSGSWLSEEVSVAHIEAVLRLS